MEYLEFLKRIRDVFDEEILMIEREFEGIFL